MGSLFLLLFLPAPMLAQLVSDPSPGIFQGKEYARNLECTRLSDVEAHEKHPGLVREPMARGSFIETGALECRRNIMDAGERNNRDEAILSQLTEISEEITENAGALFDDPNLVWLVDGYYPDVAVAAKLSTAAKTSLVERGRKVSDRTPPLAAADVLILSRLKPIDAFPAACSRYQAEGSIGEHEILLALTLIDSRETIVHAGICLHGGWRWLR